MKSIFAAALLVATVSTFGIADAMPLAPPASGANADVIQITGGCGRGFHRGPYGRCRANRGAPPVVVRPGRRCRYWGPGRRVCRTWW
ncbi:hypothetical protein NB311A_05635 [Nitrobacter sp. Nb-311A]|uniref:GCG_CRPN prefix-to-repeats domain-containing protein n=1 Tax=Nitrobacter sp. Nb-311A TaxID=314253 RepID=UPI0000684D05|nr:MULTISPECIES: hypothetical protein [unclassified Nitrobacter]EAQ34875.1 hypothetical protein NB311A_05635 [Nitrobacter sp. Nb-311A]MCV0386762.1 hypothetical protein [Nitrobacter sp.]